MSDKPVIGIGGSRESMGEDFPDELRCVNECDGGDVCVNTDTGICRICGQEHIIDTSEFLVSLESTVEEVTIN